VYNYQLCTQIDGSSVRELPCNYKLRQKTCTSVQKHFISSGEESRIDPFSREICERTAFYKVTCR